MSTATVFDTIKREFDRRANVVRAGRRSVLGLEDDDRSGRHVVWTRLGSTDDTQFGDANRTETQTWECRINAGVTDGEKVEAAMETIATVFRNLTVKSSDHGQIGFHLIDRAGPRIVGDRMQGRLLFSILVDWRP